MDTEFAACAKQVKERNVSRTINGLHSSLHEYPAPNGHDVREAVGSEGINISSVHQHFAHDDSEMVNADDKGTVGAVTSGSRPSIEPEVLKEKWGISLETAKNTLKATTQKGWRRSNEMSRRLPHQHWRNKRTIPGKWFSDTMMFPVSSITLKETCAQVMTNGQGFAHFLSTQ